MCYANNSQGIYLDEFYDNLLMLLYADDIAQVADMVGRLQKQIDILSEFCKLTGMRVNEDKTKIIVFRNGGIIRKNEKWYYNNNVIECVTYYKYLGLFYSSRLNWSYGTKTLSIQSQKSVNMLKRVISKCQNLPFKIIFKLFDTTIMPILTYASEVWGYQPYSDIENVQVNFCKYLVHVGGKTSNVAVMGELGRFPVFTSTYVKVIKYWIKLVEMDNTQLPKSAYNTLYLLDDAGKTNWVTHVKNLLYRYGFAYAYINQGVGNNAVFISLFKQRVLDNYIQEWHSIINDSPKLSCYKMFKINFELERYLSVVNIRKYLIVLCKFRCSNHQLQIELGRHMGVPREERFCNYCKKNCNLFQVEDEFHFLCVCPQYNTLRSQYIKTPRNYYEFIHIMCSKDEKTIVNLACFVYHAFRLRANSTN